MQGNTRTRPPRQPITIVHLQTIVRHIRNSDIIYHDQLLIVSAITLAFFGLLRSSEYTAPSGNTYDPSVTLLFSDITFSVNQTVAFINIKSSKTDPFKIGVTIRVGATNTECCPVHALLCFINCHNYRSGPLYTFSDGTFLTRNYVSNLLHRLWPGINIDTHSFRIGGASSAAAAGVADSTIQLLGRWSSNAYRRYIRVPDQAIVNTAVLMCSATCLNRIWDTDLCRSSSYP